MLDHRPHWEEDCERESCKRCCKKFNIIRRRHHCRLCGMLFCASCSKGRTIMPATIVDCTVEVELLYGTVKKRACTRCEGYLSEALRLAGEEEAKLSKRLYKKETVYRKDVETSWWLETMEIRLKMTTSSLAGSIATCISKTHKTPAPPVANVLSRWFAYSPTDLETVYSSLELLARLCKCVDVSRQPFPFELVVLGALVVAAKIRSEGAYPDLLQALDAHPRGYPISVSVFALIGNCSAKTVNSVEGWFLTSVDWDVHPTRVGCELYRCKVLVLREKSARRIQTFYRSHMSKVPVAVLTAKASLKRCQSSSWSISTEGMSIE
eukprot:TRINITY_DN31604_c0_g1_i1.p1 TRINITY_DN31604_c0_g1~~TRINITY_DN31604_c0_g1_i1.p1  ORF type:complete len:323 (+),score=27.65 TRINITY_DN31604_c0_g1_i1:42-1010(+)